MPPASSSPLTGVRTTTSETVRLPAVPSPLDSMVNRGHLQAKGSHRVIEAASDLLRLNHQQLGALYASASVGDPPTGRGSGTALMLPGTRLAPLLAWLTRKFAWQGKVFNGDSKELGNLVTPFGIRAIGATVYVGPSLRDGSESIILDYSKKSLVARFVRDEIRELNPGVYLGYAYSFGIPWVVFALDFNRELT